MSRSVARVMDGKPKGTKEFMEQYLEARDAGARDLVQGHLPLVRRLCRSFDGSRGPQHDLMQVGTIGLLKAIERYDPQPGTNKANGPHKPE